MDRSLLAWHRAWRFYSREVIRQLTNKDIILWAQAIAFKVLITVVPVVLLMTLLILNRSQSYDAFTNLVEGFVPSYRTDLMLDFIGDFQSVAGALTLFAALGLGVTAVTLMTTLRTVLSKIFTEKWHSRRGLIEGYLFDILMSLYLGIFMVATISVSAFVQTLHLTTSDFLAFLNIDYSLIREGWTSIIATAGYMLPVILSTIMFYVLYFVTPRPRPPAKSALIGAIVAGAMFEIAKYLFTQYAVHLGGSGILSVLGDTFGLIVGLVFWAYYCGIVLIVGALVVVLHEKRRRIDLERSSSRNEILKRI